MAEDMQGCEGCSKEFPIETMSMTGDGCWICQSCDAAFRENFSKCAHTWQPHTNDHGEPSQYCPKCTGAVRKADVDLVC